MKITPAATYVSLYLYEQMQQMLRLMCEKNPKPKKPSLMEMIRASCLETQSVPLWDWTYSKYVGFRTFLIHIKVLFGWKKYLRAIHIENDCDSLC